MEANTLEYAPPVIYGAKGVAVATKQSGHWISKTPSISKAQKMFDRAEETMKARANTQQAKVDEGRTK